MFKSRFRAPLALLLAGSLYACAPPASQDLAGSAVPNDRPLTINREPAYRQAVKLFRAKQLKQAESVVNGLLQRPDLSQEDRKFLLTQVEICRNPKIGSGDIQLSPASYSRKNPESADCGPRALSIALDALGVQADAAILRKDSATSGYGATLKGLALAARRVGMKAEGVRMDLHALKGLQQPAVAWFNGDHFVAVLRVRGDRVLIHDPNATGEEWVDTEHLFRRSGGILLILSR